jgi:hypothetical protein
MSDVPSTDLATVIADMAEVNVEGTRALEKALADLRARAQRRGGKVKGRVSITLELAATHDAVSITAKVASKVEGSSSVASYYTTPSGRLSKAHPKQIELDVRDLPHVTEIRDPSKGGN